MGRRGLAFAGQDAGEDEGGVEDGADDIRIVEMVKKKRMGYDAGEKCAAYDHDEEVLQNAQKTAAKCCLARRHIRVQDLFPIHNDLSLLSLFHRGKCSLLVYEMFDWGTRGGDVGDGADVAGKFAKRKETKFR